jgi:DNA-binding CsgD family transcriptional regulator
MSVQQIMDFYEDLYESRDVDHCFHQYMNYVGQFGLSGGVLVSSPYVMTCPLESDNISYVSAYDPGFFRDYLAAGGVKNDLSAQLLFATRQNKIDFCISDDNCCASELLGREVTREELLIKEISLDYQINFGYAVSLDTYAGRMTRGFGVSAVGMGKEEYRHEVVSHEREIKQANYFLGLALRQFQLPEGDTCRDALFNLSSRQYDLLRWLADGLRLQEIADSKIHRSVHTINKDLQVLKRMLQASTQEELVAKGIIMGLIA